MRVRARIAAAVVTVVAVVVIVEVVAGGSSGNGTRAQAAARLPRVGVIARRVEQLRGLRFRYVPRVEVVSAHDLAAKVSSGTQVVARRRGGWLTSPRRGTRSRR